MISIRYSFRSVLSAHPLIYMPIARRKYGRLDDRIVRPDTELVIDGFERSGNWFAVAGFLGAQRRSVKLAHHLHAPAQVSAAVRLRIPAIVLVRKPEDAVVSQMIRSRGVRPRQALAAWVRYYKHVLPIRDRVVVADFQRVITDFGSVIAEVNAKFGTDFERFESTAQNVQRSFAWIDEVNRERYGAIVETAVARPSDVREEMKAAFVRRVGSRAIAPLRERAAALYGDLIDDPRDQTGWPAGREGPSWIRRRLDPASPRGLTLTLVTMLAAAAASLFGNLVEGIAGHEDIIRFDERVTRLVSLHRDGLLTAMMRAVARLGAFEVIVPLGVIVSVWFVWRRGDWAPAVRILIAIAATAAVSDVIQNALDRPRPALSLEIIKVSGWAFPAERAAECVAFYGLVVLILATGRTRLGQALLWVVGALIVILVGASRVYLGVHWLSDVVAGYALGAVILCSIVAPTLLRERRTPDMLPAR